MTESNPTPLERLRRSGIAPAHGLGQNFLIDPNILDVIERMASLALEDVVLEVGPGLGVLTERLLDRCRLVHCLELDRRLAALLEGEFGSRSGFRLQMGDAVRLDFATLDPPPDKFVANLPYNVAAPLVMRSLAELPSISLWCLMLQKEVADRLFAAVGGPNYGGISVMVQLLAEKISSRPVPATVFYPRPRVKSSLLAFRRRERQGYAIEDFARVKAVVYAAFSHRRKMMVNSLSEAWPGTLPPAIAARELPERKAWLEGLLKDVGMGAGARAQELAPLQFEELVRLMDSYGT
ncbi:MAG: 16S rRNA (adenine(1518)-N(6)/adenine(1519)-N(6))-dimethyltransferase RsmA [Thermoleophilia bacterium]|nr:16S rRNA (adenine(1518)-N(6)/adenine(1519)-N(6))-dimethyltransferase RsmA [Thermoleophilia bacterium]